jgi:hypothetical protein
MGMHAPACSVEASPADAADAAAACSSSGRCVEEDTEWQEPPPPPDYEFIIWPPPQQPRFQPWDEVYVRLHSNKDTGRAMLLTWPAREGAPPAPRAAGDGTDSGGSGASGGGGGPGARGEQQQQRQQQGGAAAPPAKVRAYVVYRCCRTTFNVNVARMTRWYRAPGARRVLLVHSTAEYRALARSQVGHGDFVVEIGSSYGICTAILASQCDNVLGIEVGPPPLLRASACARCVRRRRSRQCACAHPPCA